MAPEETDLPLSPWVFFHLFLREYSRSQGWSGVH